MKYPRTSRGTAGFTLIELLVVVMIIGILAAVAVPQYFKVVEKSRVSEATAYIGEFNAEQGRYFAQYSMYFSNINADGSGGPEGALPTLSSCWQPTATGGGAQTMTLTMTRATSGACAVASSIGAYTVTSSATGGGAFNIQCGGQAFCNTICGTPTCTP